MFGMEDYPTTQKQFSKFFRSERTCVDYLCAIRWPGGFKCPQCGSIKAWVVARGLRMCQKCDHQTSVTAGTIFHGTRKPLRKWFRAIWHLTDPEHRTSVVDLQKALGLNNYRIAWAWVHKLRKAMMAAGGPLSDVARKGDVPGTSAFGMGAFGEDAFGGVTPGSRVARSKGSRRKGALPVKKRAASSKRKQVDRGRFFCQLIQQAVTPKPQPRSRAKARRSGRKR
jgi:hypothetical protein